MQDVHKFPMGYEVKIINKHDIIASIDDNILDKEVALEIVKRCEIDASNFLKEGRWTGIPFIGNIRIPKTTQKLLTEESKHLLQGAKETLDENMYVMFRKNYTKEIGKQVNLERFYKYTVSMFVGKNQKFFKKVSLCFGDLYARVLCYTLRNLKAVSNEQI